MDKNLVGKSSIDNKALRGSRQEMVSRSKLLIDMKKSKRHWSLANDEVSE